MKNHSTIVAGVAAAALVACGGGGESAPTSSAARIQYAQITPVGKGRVADYLNADWLYDNYFGQMGLPPEIKSKLMVEMRRLSNGFALQLAIGDDVVSNSAHFHTTMSSGVGQSMLARFAQRLSDTNATLPLTAGTAPDEQALAEAPKFDDVDRTHATVARETDRVALANLQAVATTFGLPYNLTRDPTPYISWSANFIAQKGGKGGGGGGGGGGGASTAHGTNSWPWLHGDIMFLRWNQISSPSKDSFPLGHMAIIANPPGALFPIATDAHPENPSAAVKRWIDAEELATRYKFVQGLAV